jgi:septal ring factor EnvC (AmiA/AmiB activator)
MDDATLNQRFEAMAELIHQLAERMDERFDKVDQRFTAVEQRLDRMENRMTAMEFQMAGINRSVDSSDRQFSQVLVTQGAQQKALDDLAARVTRLERQRSEQ